MILLHLCCTEYLLFWIHETCDVLHVRDLFASVVADHALVGS